jgi:hypothetical protein
VKETSYEVAPLEREGNRHREEKCTRIVTNPSADAFHNLSYAQPDHLYDALRDENESLN